MNKRNRFILISVVVILHFIKRTKAQGLTATITEFKDEHYGNGEYKFRFVQSDGTEREESGKFKGEGNYAVEGYYTYIDPTGEKQRVEYYADNTGYHPKIVQKQGIPIPIPPVGFGLPLPPAAVATLIG